MEDQPKNTLDTIYAIASAAEATAMSLVEAAISLRQVVEDYREKTAFPHTQH